MVALLDARTAANPIDWTGVPDKFRYKRLPNGHFAEQPSVSAVVRTLTEAEDLVKFYGGSEFCPFLPVLLMIPGQVPTLIIGNGGTPDTMADAAELRDLAVSTFNRAIQRVVENKGKIFDFAALRSERGLPAIEDVDGMIRQALWDRGKRHRANWRTDPARQAEGPAQREWYDMGAAASSVTGGMTDA